MSDLIRHFGGLPGEPYKGEVLSHRDQVGRLRAVRDEMGAQGFPVFREDEGGHEIMAPHFEMETGHCVSVGLSRKDAGWNMTIHHPGDIRSGRTMIHVSLGTRDKEVPGLVRRELGCRHVTGEMMRQMRASGQAGPRQKNNFTMVRHDAEGAALPGAGEDDWP